MTSTLDRPTVTGGGADTPVVSLQAPTTKKPSWVVAGVVLVGLAALLGAYVFNAATDTIRVTVAARTLEPGEPIGLDDLDVIELGRTNQVVAIVPEQQQLIVGLTPRAVIPARTVLNTGLFVPADEVVPEGSVVVGASFSNGAIPTASLAPGQPVSILIVSDDPALAIGDVGTVAEATRLGTATVWSVETEPGQRSGNETWLSLLVDAGLETRFAQAASDGDVRLSLVNP